MYMQLKECLILSDIAASIEETVLKPAVGETVRLPCSSSSSVLDRYWTFTELESSQPHQINARQFILNGFSEQFSLETTAANTYNLVITNIGSKNTGVYRCIGRETEEPTERPTLYRVLVQPAGALSFYWSA